MASLSPRTDGAQAASRGDVGLIAESLSASPLRVSYRAAAVVEQRDESGWSATGTVMFPLTPAATAASTPRVHIHAHVHVLLAVIVAVRAQVVLAVIVAARATWPWS